MTTLAIALIIGFASMVNPVEVKADCPFITNSTCSSSVYNSGTKTIVIENCRITFEYCYGICDGVFELHIGDYEYEQFCGIELAPELLYNEFLKAVVLSQYPLDSIPHCSEGVKNFLYYWNYACQSISPRRIICNNGNPILSMYKLNNCGYDGGCTIFSPVCWEGDPPNYVLTVCPGYSIPRVTCDNRSQYFLFMDDFLEGYPFYWDGAETRCFIEKLNDLKLNFRNELAKNCPNLTGTALENCIKAQVDADPGGIYNCFLEKLSELLESSDVLNCCGMETSTERWRQAIENIINTLREHYTDGYVGCVSYCD